VAVDQVEHLVVQEKSGRFRRDFATDAARSQGRRITLQRAGQPPRSINNEGRDRSVTPRDRDPFGSQDYLSRID
jgi:hypothetical protein